MSLPYTYIAGYMKDRDSAPTGDISKLITGELFEKVFEGFQSNDDVLLPKNNGVWENNLSSEDGALSLTNGSITLTNGSLNAKIDGGDF